MSKDRKLMQKARALQQQAAHYHRSSHEQLRRELCARQPRIEALDRAMRACFLDALAAPDRDAMAKAELEIACLRAEQEDLLRQLGTDPADYAERPLCPRCRDTGRAETGACQCVLQFYRDLQSRALSSLLNIDGQNFDRFDLSLFSEAHHEAWGGSPRQQAELLYEICLNFSRRFKPGADNLLFSGPPGTGKTFLSSCIADVVNQGGFSVYYDTVIHQMRKWESVHFGRSDEDAEWDIQRMRRCDLLIIDDLGTEFLSPYAQTALMDLISTRLIERKTMLISTNLTRARLTERYQGPLASRLTGAFLWLDFWGDDLRQKKD